MSQWKLLSDPVTQEQAAKAAEKESQGGIQYRLPTKAELLAALPADGQFAFGYTKAVWTCEPGLLIDPQSDAIAVNSPDAMVATVLVVGPRERPAAPKKRQLRVLGYLESPTFQQCREAAEYLNKDYSELYSVAIAEMLGVQFERKRETLVEKSPDVAQAGVVVLDENTGTAEDGDAFIRHVVATTGFKLFDVPDTDPQSYVSLARASQSKFLKTTGSTFAWMLIKVDDQVAGRIVFQLYSDICPKTCQNFVHLCRGDLPDATDADGKPVKLSYKGSNFFRIVANGWIQGGDIHGEKTGTSGWSIYGRHFPDESFKVPHDDEGILGMANDGEHTNSSSFYVTAGKSKWMDGRYVAFGRVVEGMAVVKRLLALETKHNQAPKQRVVVDDCNFVSLDS